MCDAGKHADNILDVTNVEEFTCVMLVNMQTIICSQESAQCLEFHV